MWSLPSGSSGRPCRAKKRTVNGQVELCCEDCEAVVKDIHLINRRVCPECGGRMAGIRFFRNPLTGKILFAESLEL